MRATTHRKQDAFVAALVTEPTILAAAKQAGISEAAAYRWLKEPEIAEAYREARRAAVQQAVTLLQRAARAAVSTLIACLSAEHPAAVRVRAATAILDGAMRGIEIDDLAARVEQLEAAVEETRAEAENGRRYA